MVELGRRPGSEIADVVAAKTNTTLEYPNGNLSLGFTLRAAVVLQPQSCLDDRYAQVGCNEDLCPVHGPVEVVAEL